jgi:DNA repair photolyase
MVRPLPIANPPNPWSSTHVEWIGEPPEARLHVYEERSKTILNHVTSPDVGMKWSLNPYRGCMHGCAYCYARPTHQYWGFGAGSDFDRNIIVRINAPDLLREAFDKKAWVGESITFSGNTDCYQPIEASYRLTRRCLEVCLAYRNPLHVITKSALIRRDIEILSSLARDARCSVTLSIPFAHEEMARAIEPYASAPTARFETIRALTQAGVACYCNIAPVIPGLNDVDVAEILERAKDAGAIGAACLPVRLAAEVLPVFLERLAVAYPDRLEKVRHAVQQIRNGKMNVSEFGERMRGDGPRWDAIRRLFETHCKRLGLGTWEADDEGAAPDRDPDAPTTFERPKAQQELF